MSIKNLSVPDGQKIEMMVDEIFWFIEKDPNNDIEILSDKDSLKLLYMESINDAKEWLAISNIDNWLKIDENWLQEFRKTLNDNNINVRVICKQKWVKHEPNGLKSRELKVLDNKYLLVSNIDIVDTYKIIITRPWKVFNGIVIEDGLVYAIFKEMFYNLRNKNQYVLWVNSGDDVCTDKWLEIMTTGKNFWIDYVINPVLYPIIFSHLKSADTKLVDFWCGINSLGMQLLYWLPSQIPALSSIQNIQLLRKNITSFLGFEANSIFVKQAFSLANDIGDDVLSVFWKELVAWNPLPLDSSSLSCCLSRNFIVHLNYEDLNYHFSEAYRILKPWGTYILATLNPDYEQKKYKSLTQKELIDGDRYNHYHGNNGEWWTWIQYFKKRSKLEEVMKKYFVLTDSVFCFPINSDGEVSYARYYDKDCPMAIVYTLTKQ